ncbi:unnamed protein product [Prunus brigantina]
MYLGWNYMILPWIGEEAIQELEVKSSMALFDPLERAPNGRDWRRYLIYYHVVQVLEFTLTPEGMFRLNPPPSIENILPSPWKSTRLGSIRNRLKSDWTNLQEEVSIDHISRDWYKIEFYSEEDVDFVLKHRPWFVQGQIFALQKWKHDFSQFHVSADIDLASMVGKQSIFVRVCLEVGLTKPLKSQKNEPGHVCPIKISNKNYLQVERLNNEPNFFPKDLVLDEED